MECLKPLTVTNTNGANNLPMKKNERKREIFFFQAHFNIHRFFYKLSSAVLIKH